MANKKATKKYYFSVEGETEHWYLKWLQELINANEEARYKVSFECPVNKNPYKYAKKLNVLNKTEIYHFFDCEGDEEMYVQRFKDAMDNMKKAQTAGKQITYILLRLTGHLEKVLRAWMSSKKRIILSVALRN